MTTILNLELLPLFEYLSKRNSDAVWEVIFEKNCITRKEHEEYNAQQLAYYQAIELLKKTHADRQNSKTKTGSFAHFDWQQEISEEAGIMPPLPPRGKTLMLLRAHKLFFEYDSFSTDNYHLLGILVENVSEEVKQALRLEYPSMYWAENEPDEFDYFEYATAQAFVKRMRHEHVHLDRLVKLKALTA